MWEVRVLMMTMVIRLGAISERRQYGLYVGMTLNMVRKSYVCPLDKPSFPLLP